MSDQFQFINFSDTTPVNAETRTRIRQHAMRKVGIARRKRGNHDKQSTRQPRSEDEDSREYPSNIAAWKGNHPIASPDAEHLGLTVGRPWLDLYQSLSTTPSNSSIVTAATIPRSPSSTGYERVRIQYDFDVHDLSAFTNLQSSSSNTRMLHKEPFTSQRALKHRPWSYFSYLPSRYGRNSYLDNAVHCLAARVRQYLSAPLEPPEQHVMALYNRALLDLQTALGDPATSLEADVLCATALLAIYELLNGLNAEAWIRHITGASAMLRNRGPDHYKSDYEKALLITFVGPIFADSIATMKSCFLETPEWQSVLKSLIFEQGTFSDGSEIVISLWERISGLPYLAVKVQNLVKEGKAHDADRVNTLKKHSTLIRNSLHEWHERFEALAQQIMSDSSLRGYSYGKRHEILGIYFCCMIFANRLNIALAPDSSEAVDLEAEAQEFAESLQNLAWEADTLGARASLYTAHKAHIAQATIDTKSAWHELLTGVESTFNDNLAMPIKMNSERALALWFGCMCR